MPKCTAGIAPLRRAAARPRRVGDLAGIIVWTGVGLASAQAQGVCDRTPQVRDELVEVTRVSSCEAVTAQHLAGVTRLELHFSGIHALQAHDFSGLNDLRVLDLEGKSLTTLLQGIFSGLNDLRGLSLNDSITRQLACQPASSVHKFS